MEEGDITCSIAGIAMIKYLFNDFNKSTNCKLIIIFDNFAYFVVNDKQMLARNIEPPSVLHEMLNV